MIQTVGPNSKTIPLKQENQIRCRLAEARFARRFQLEWVKAANMTRIRAVNDTGFFESYRKSPIMSRNIPDAAYLEYPP
jgi:hypothetical protein